MDKLYGLRKLMKVLYPDVKFVVRITKKKNYEIIVKNVKYTEYNQLTFHRILVLKNGKEVIIDNFINDITSEPSISIFVFLSIFICLIALV